MRWSQVSSEKFFLFLSSWKFYSLCLASTLKWLFKLKFLFYSCFLFSHLPSAFFSIMMLSVAAYNGAINKVFHFQGTRTWLILGEWERLLLLVPWEGFRIARAGIFKLLMKSPKIENFFGHEACWGDSFKDLPFNFQFPSPLAATEIVGKMRVVSRRDLVSRKCLPGRKSWETRFFVITNLGSGEIRDTRHLIESQIKKPLWLLVALEMKRLFTRVKLVHWLYSKGLEAWLFD